MFQKQSKSKIGTHIEAKCASARSKLYLKPSLRRWIADSDFPSLLTKPESTSLGWTSYANKLLIFVPLISAVIFMGVIGSLIFADPIGPTHFVESL